MTGASPRRARRVMLAMLVVVALLPVALVVGDSAAWLLVPCLLAAGYALRTAVLLAREHRQRSLQP